MIRHGESEDNVLKVFGRYESPLSKNGVSQIKDTKELLKDFNYSKVYYSPFKRTVETLNVLGLDGQVDERIGEYDFGIFAGLDHKTIEKKYPIKYKEWNENPTEYVIEDGESLQIVYKRVKEFLEEIVKNGESVVLVTHAGVIRLAFCWMFDNIDYFFKFKVDNGSINVISVDETNFKFVERSNYTPKQKNLR